MKTILFFLVAPLAAVASSRTSASYAVATESADGGGRRVASASYTSDSSLGGIAGISTVAAPSATAKAGYLAQLYEITGLTLTTANANVNEGATLQLGAWQALDDATYLAVPGASVAWSVQSGPLTINATGLAMGGVVHQDTAAVAKGTHGGHNGTLGLTVIETIGDNLGTYAADGIADAWQVQYFGTDNPDAAPGVDADHDGQANRLEFLAGYVPTDPASHFVTRGLGMEAGLFTMELSQVKPGTRYIFERTTDFPSWTTVFTLDPATPAAPLEVDLPTSGDRSFFRVQLTTP